MNRRKMIQSSALAVGGFCTCSMTFGKDIPKSNCCFTPEIEPSSLSFSKEKIIVDLEKASTISEPGYAAFIIDEERGIDLILVQDATKKFRALQRLCTHGGRSVSYIPEREMLQCNNYNHSTFELNGEVYNGPAPTSLISYIVDRKDSFLEISL